MADFYDIHWGTIEAQMKHRIAGDRFQIAMREPIGVPSPEPTVKGAVVHVVTFKVTRDHDGFAPATEGDAQLIRNWNKRHKYTTSDTFRLPTVRIA